MASLKATAKGLLAGILRLFSRKPAIVFESAPDFADNTFAVFRELWTRGYGKKYQFVWSCSGVEQLPASYGKIKYIHPMRQGLKAKLKNAYYMANAKCMISCNRFLLPWRKNQVAIYLAHGTPMKSVYGYYWVPEAIHYCLSAAPGVEEMTAYQFHADREKMFSLGYPRNDLLCHPCDVKRILNTQCEKVVVWYPTFRQHNKREKLGSGHAMPIIHDAQAARSLNEWAIEKNVLIVMKPHFAQDLTYIKDLGLSNIRFIDDGLFREHNITSYSFVAGCDGLLTDYSSIYFDYMLCDKPIGLIWEDVEEYRQNPGFAVDLAEYGQGGVIIFTLPELKRFIEDIAAGTDTCKENRNALCDRVNFSRDGKNSARVADFIVEKAKL